MKTGSLVKTMNNLLYLNSLELSDKILDKILESELQGSQFHTIAGSCANLIRFYRNSGSQYKAWQIEEKLKTYFGPNLVIVQLDINNPNTINLSYTETH